MVYRFNHYDRCCNAGIDRYSRFRRRARKLTILFCSRSITTMVINGAQFVPIHRAVVPILAIAVTLSAVLLTHFGMRKYVPATGRWKVKACSGTLSRAHPLRGSGPDVAIGRLETCAVSLPCYLAFCIYGTGLVKLANRMIHPAHDVSRSDAQATLGNRPATARESKSMSVMAAAQVGADTDLILEASSG